MKHELQYIDIDGIRLAYLDVGDGPETVVFSHSYLFDHRHFEHQIEALARHYRVIAFDHRDHGQSDRVDAGYVLDDLVADAISLIERLDVGPVHFVGLSTGGFVGMRIALKRPELIARLVLMDTDAGRDGFVGRLRNFALLTALRFVGVAPLVGTAMRLMFGRRFLGDPERRDEAEMWRRRLGENEAGALIRFARAILARDDVTARLAGIRAPTLVVVGEYDRALPPVAARRIARAIPGAALSVIPDAGHLCTVDQPSRVSDVLMRFLNWPVRQVS